MNDFLIFQYLSSIIYHKSLSRLIQYASKSAIVILDLEDSIQDVTDENNTRFKKKQSRNNLRNLSNVLSDMEVGIRINQINSSEYQNDLELLSELIDVKWKYIVLPKIEAYNEIQQLLNDISNVNYQEIVICIESVKGLGNLNKILKTIKSERISKISKVQFGHFDYFLDKGIFPIPEQTSSDFWDTCEKLIKEVEESGYTYLHTPINVLNSENLTNSIIRQLNETCKKEFGFATVSMTQNFLLRKFDESKAEPLLIKNNNAINKINYANEIIISFSKSKSNFSFEHKIKDRIFIPPQEYYAAKLFLSNL